jgi:hypothetical protein
VGNSDAFWSMSSAWWSSRADAQAKARGMRLGPASSGRLVELSDGSHWVTGGDPDHGAARMDPRLREDILVLVQRVPTVTVEAYDDRLGELAVNAFAAWPVRSGLSRAMLSLEYRAEDDGGSLRGRLSSRAPYTADIKGQPHQVLIEGPAPDVVRAIGEQIVEELARG